MAKRSLTPWLIIGGIIVVVILIASVLLFSPSPQPVKMSNLVITVPPTTVAESAPQAPSCTIAINGQKVPPFTDDKYPNQSYGKPVADDNRNGINKIKLFTL